MKVSFWFLNKESGNNQSKVAWLAPAQRHTDFHFVCGNVPKSV